MTNSTQETDRYECDGTYKGKPCHKLLFCGSLRLLLTKAQQPKDAIKVKCSRCGHINVFTPQPMVLK